MAEKPQTLSTQGYRWVQGGDLHSSTVRWKDHRPAPVIEGEADELDASLPFDLRDTNARASIACNGATSSRLMGGARE